MELSKTRNCEVDDAILQGLDTITKRKSLCRPSRCPVRPPAIAL